MSAPNRTTLCGACRGKSAGQWCRSCRSRNCVPRDKCAPDYVAMAIRDVEARTHVRYDRFTRPEHQAVNALLLAWAQARGLLLDYRPVREPKDTLSTVQRQRRARERAEAAS